MLKNILYIILIYVLYISTTFADADVTLSIQWWTTKNVFYQESTTITANATFADTCTSTWITWTHTVPWFPFPTVVTVGTWPSYTFSPSINETFTVTANCSAVQVVDFVSITIKVPEVTAWANTQYNSWDTVSLSWGIYWTPCTTFDYQWEQISWPSVTISNTAQTLVNSPNYNLASFTFPDTTDEIKLKLKVTPQSCYHWGNTYSWTVIYTINSSWWGWWWGSWIAAAQDEAIKIFYDSWSIDKVNINLKMTQQDYSPLLHFNWNSIWWEWQVYYKLEYSTWSTFTKYTTYETTSITYSLLENFLDKNSQVHYFRVRAWYMDKYSKYSNIIKYYSDDYLKISCNIKNIKLPSFDDIFLWTDFLLEDYYQPICTKCTKMIDFKDLKK